MMKMNTHNIVCVCFILFVCLWEAQGECYVRVNQLGFVAKSKKTAVVMCAETLAGTTAFQVTDATSGTVAYKGTVGTKSSLTWSTTYANEYTVNFTTVTTPGTYNVILQTSPQVKSFKFHVSDTAANLYTDVLQKSIFFFRAQRDGPEQFSEVLKRKPSHLTDATATVYKTPTYKKDQIQGDLVKVGGPVNVTGGWFDAGDYIKFVETASYVVVVQLLAVRDHPSLLKKGGNADFYSEALYGLQWLAKMWDDSKKVLHYQVGIGDGNSKILADHDVWRLPEADDALNVKAGDSKYYLKYRPVFAVGDGASGSLISPNLAGRVAAAFALGYQTYKTSEPTFAKQLLTYAQNVWNLKDTNPKTLLTTAPFDYYPESEWRDDLELGATELYFATKAALEAGDIANVNAEDYLTEASSWATQYISKGEADTINLYDTAGLAHYELWKALGTAGVKSISGLTRDDLVNNIKKQLGVGVSNFKKDIFGFGDKYDSGDDLAPHGFGYALQASFLKEIQPSSAADYDDFAQAQVSWQFGDNAWGTSFMIGVGESFAFCPQHQVANLVGSLNGTLTGVGVLLGAVGDGPSQTDNFSGLDGTPDGGKKCPPNGVDNFKKFSGQGVRYMDDVSAWPSVEPADDYSVLPVLLFARYIDA